MRRLLALSAIGLLVIVAGGAAADTFAVTLVSQTTSTVTLGWSPQPGYGYLFSADGVLVSRTNDPSRNTVKFSKASYYDIDVITKGANGHYPSAPPPPPKAQCEDGVDNDGDGKIDYPADLGCTAATDNDETNVVTPPPPTGFPDSSNTGIPAGTTLTAYTGPSNITTPNTVIDGKSIGCIQINATGVVIRNSRISCAGGYALYIDDKANYARSSNGTVALVTVEDSEIDCKNGPGSAVGEADFVIRRVEITGCENGFDMNQNGLIEDSFIHNLYAGGGAHTDGLQASGRWNGSVYLEGMGNVTIRHNTIFGQGAPNDSLFGTSAIISARGGDTNVLIENNLLAGGSYTLYCEQNGTKGTNYRVLNNRFSTRFKATVGYFGPVTDCQDETASGNLYYETGLPVPGIG